MRRLSIFSVAVVSIALAQSSFADITGSSVTHNLGSATANANLDLAPPGLNVDDWAVFSNSASHSNELLGGVSNFGALQFSGVQLSTSPTALPSWTLDFTGAANGAPPSGTTFGYGALWANPFSTNSISMDITPNVSAGSTGVVRVFGQLDLGGTFGGQQSDTTISMLVDGSPDADGDQMWNLGTTIGVDTFMYELTFDNYNGETYTFTISTNFNALQPEHNIAGVQVASFAIPEPSSMFVIPIVAMVGLGVRRFTKKRS